jgi:hypothetical protein
MVGVFLWRGGAVLAGVAAVFESIRWILRLVDVPSQLEIALGLFLSGFALVLLSLLAERVQDYRRESGVGQ